MDEDNGVNENEVRREGLGFADCISDLRYDSERHWKR